MHISECMSFLLVALLFFTSIPSLVLTSYISANVDSMRTGSDSGARKEASFSTDCNLFIDGINVNSSVVNHRVDMRNYIVKLVQQSPNLELPQHSSCSCSSEMPAFVAPMDLCSDTAFDFSGSSFCSRFGTLQRPIDHVLVCLQEEQIDYLWYTLGYCQYPYGNGTLPILNRGYLTCFHLFKEIGAGILATVTLGQVNKLKNDGDIVQVPTQSVDGMHRV
jgi:hypothetical protein